MSAATKSKKCPECKLINSLEAIVCDCGYGFFDSSKESQQAVAITAIKMQETLKVELHDVTRRQAREEDQVNIQATKTKTYSIIKKLNISFLVLLSLATVVTLFTSSFEYISHKGSVIVEADSDIMENQKNRLEKEAEFELHNPLFKTHNIIKVYDHTLKSWTVLSLEGSEAYLIRGSYTLRAAAPVPVIAPDGDYGTIPSEEIVKALNAGFKLLSYERWNNKHIEELNSYMQKKQGPFDLNRHFFIFYIFLSLTVCYFVGQKWVYWLVK